GDRANHHHRRFGGDGRETFGSRIGDERDDVLAERGLGDLQAGVHVPDADIAADTAFADQLSAVAGPDDLRDPARMPLEDAERLPGRDFPDTSGAVERAARGEVSAAR